MSAGVPWLVMGLALGACGRASFDRLPDAAVDAVPPLDVLGLAEACPDDPDLLACFAFEGNVNDATGRSTMTSSDVSFVPGIDGLAVSMGAASRIDGVVFDLAATEVTLEAWIRPRPNAQQSLVIDHNATWATGINPGDIHQCSLSPLPPLEGDSVELDTWQHIACTYGPAATTAYRGGRPTTNAAPMPIQGGNDAFAIGGNAPTSDDPRPFLGLIDRVRIWRRVLSPTEVCVAAGNSDC